MASEYLRLGMDSMILFFLVLTVYFAFRLSKNLTEFRSYRGELQEIMKTLAQQLERAQSVIQDIKEISQTSGQDIDDMVQKSRIAAEELRSVNEVSEVLANRLEHLARGNRETSSPTTTNPPQQNEEEAIQNLLNDLKQELDSNSSQIVGDEDIPEFLKRAQHIETSTNTEQKMMSEAERDLYEALQKQKG